MTEHELFAAAVKLTGDKRSAFLAAACGRDAPLREQVEDLLRAHDESGGLLPRKSDRELEATYLMANQEASGTLIAGRYKLLEQIGEGGMGAVWVAEQTEPVRRKVALKLIKTGMDSRSVLARFEAERQALAMMDHPNIAKVLDGGLTQIGRPYFVMEYVKGVPITEYCDATRLSVPERLKLFVEVCSAIQHAHQKGIIHRDLKPSNILVAPYDDKAVPKVIDFGLAKAMHQSLTERTLHTAHEVVLGTPLYMSPEQAQLNNLDVDTRSDIYSLGVLLYELLTGTTPLEKQRFKEAAWDEIKRIIHEEEPPKPSTRLSSTNTLPLLAAGRQTEPAKLTKLVRGEIDWIVMKSLEKDRTRRYETASAFALDIQRYLAGEPVLAAPPSAGYRLRKFVRRNRGPVLAAALLLLALVGGITGTSWGLIRAEKARRAEEEARQLAQANEQKAVTAAAREAEQRRLAEERRVEAAARADAEAQARTELQTSLYYQLIAQAEGQLLAQNVGRAEELLEECPLHLRGWEWGYLQRWRHGNSLSLEGHKGRVQCVAFSPVDSCLASGGDDGTVRLWDPATGKELRVLGKRGNAAWSVAFSPDGKRLASGGSDKTVKVWDVASGQEIQTLQAPTTTAPWFVVFSPDGRRLASAGHALTITLWDLTSGQELFTLRGHAGWIEGLAFSPDGGRLASGSFDETIKLWDARTGQEILTIRGHTGAVTGVAFSPDGQRLASASWDGTVRIWDAATGREIMTLFGHTGLAYRVAYSPDGRRLASTGWDKTVKIWDAATGQEILTLRGHSDDVFHVAYSPDGRRLASASWDQTVRIWDATPLEDRPGEVLTLPSQAGTIFGVAFSPDGRRLASASWDQTVKVWDVVPGGDAFGKEIFTLPNHTRLIWGVAFSPDGQRLASASWDQTVKLWDLTRGQEIQTLRGHPGIVWSVAFSPDGRQLASGSFGGVLKIWDTETGKEIQSVRAALNILGLAFSPDGQRLASAGHGGVVQVFDVASGNVLLNLKGHRDMAMGVKYSPDGRRLATASEDQTVRVWDATTGQVIHILTGHTDRVPSVAFSPDGRRLASGGGDGTVRLWDAETGQDIGILRGHAGMVWSVAFSPDGTHLASGSGYRGKGEVKVWDLARWSTHLSTGRP